MKLVYGRECRHCGAGIPPHKNMSATCCEEPRCIKQRRRVNNSRRKLAKMEWARRPENAVKQWERHHNRSDAQRRIDRNKATEAARKKQSLSPKMGRDYYRPWTSDEDMVVLDPSLSRVEKAWLLNRSYSSINNRQHALRSGARPSAPEMWSKDETAVLMRTDLTLTEMAELTGRSQQSVGVKRSKLRDHGIEVPMFKSPWTPEEDDIICGAQVPARELARVLGRSEAAVGMRAHHLKVSLAHWEGWWSEEETSIIMRPDLSVQQMSKMIGRDPNAIKSHRSKLKRRGMSVQKIGVCRRGHLYTPENSGIDERGGRHCRECQMARVKSKRVKAEARRRARAEMIAASKCKEDGCNSRPVARGWCGLHYQRWHRTGSVSKVGRNERIYAALCRDCLSYFEGRTRSCPARFCPECRKKREANRRQRRNVNKRLKSAHQRALLFCTDCGIHVANAQSVNRRYCDSCARERKRAIVRRWHHRRQKEKVAA